MSLERPLLKPRRYAFLRLWLPILIALLGCLGLVAIWLNPSENMSHSDRMGATMGTTMATVSLLVIWFLAFGFSRFWLRLLLVAALIGCVVAAVKSVHFSGDFDPIVQFRWSPNRDDILEAYRKSQPSATVPASEPLPPDLPTDFLEYRGASRAGIVTGPILTGSWKPRPPSELWRHPSGGGYAGFAVKGNLAFTIEQRRDKEAIVCYDAATGHELWLFDYPADFEEALGGPGPRTTPTIAANRVYSLGATGMLVCLDLATGAPQWSVNILENNENVRWAMSGSPLVYKNVVVVNPGSQQPSAEGHALVAYDRESGKELWHSGQHKAAYASPMLATLAGKRQLVILDADGLAGCDPSSGQEWWRYEWKSYMDINVAQPLILPGDRIFISAGYGHGCMLVQVSHKDGSWSAQPVWPEVKKTMKCKFTSPVLYQGNIYGLDEGVLACIDADTGERKWRDGRYGHGQLLLTGDKLLILGETGKLVLVAADPKQFTELGSIQALNGKTWNCPALSNGKAYVRNDQEMACYRLPRIVETAQARR
jgi:outer membrane protein assembly factor BamB